MSKKTIVKVILKNLVFQEKSLNNVMNKNGLLNTIQVEEQVVSKKWKQEVFSMLYSWRHLHNKYTTAPQTYKRFSNLI